jgi:DEAD/DEAH box helicase domain-containing protein
VLVCILLVQAGRAGRRSQASLSVYVAFDGPLDQHFMAHPATLFQRPIECVQVSAVGTGATCFVLSGRLRGVYCCALHVVRLAV